MRSPNRLLFIFALSFLFLSAQSQDLTGFWKSQKYDVTYDFKQDSSVLFTQGEFPLNIHSYSIDKKKSPMWIDFKINEGGMEITIPGLLKVVNENKIIIEQFPPFEDRPSEFSVLEEAGMISQHVLIRQR